MNPDPDGQRREPGHSRLPYVLAGIGLALSSAAGLYTYSLLHEQQESLGAAVVDHIAASKCTAINSTLAALSVARGEVLSGDRDAAAVDPIDADVIGVVTPGSWRLQDFHSRDASAAAVVRTLQSLPPEAWWLPSSSPSPSASASAPLRPQALPADLLQRIRPYTCPLRYGLRPEGVRVYAIRNPLAADDHTHHSAGAHAGGAHTSGNGTWLALVYGPWPHDAAQKSAFALLDLSAATLQASGHDHGLQELFPDGSGRLEMAMELLTTSAATAALTDHAARRNLEEEDHKLLGLRIIPFANQVLRGELSVDHALLDRVPRRSGALVFLLGLLATSCVVAISRRSELSLRRFNRALLRESRTDGLTGLANRRSWDEAIQREEGRRQRYGHVYGILVVDLDGFKQVNDQLGHAVGDAVLKNAAEAMRAVVRDTDLLARVGGDEFTVLSLDPTSRGLDELVSRLRDALEQAGIRASIGFAMSAPQATLDQTWAEADARMYGCKTRSPGPRSQEPHDQA
ncbi:MAG: GGDEF domain-containing protein [Cyanobium sp.]